MTRCGWVWLSLNTCIVFAAGAWRIPVAQAQSVSVTTIFEKYNLLGIFATDCSKPASKSNPYFVNRALGADRVQRDQMSGPTTRDTVTVIDKATPLGPNEIALSGTRDGKPAEITWRIDGNKLISSGRWVGNGADS